MISFIKCKDFPKKEYFDEIDESSVFVRREQCKHFEIAMKRKSDDGKFQKFVITFVCKGCQNEEKLEFKESGKTYEYTCLRCNYGPMTFGYQNTMDDSADIKNKNENNQDEGGNNVININNMPYMDDQVLGGEKKIIKKYKTPNNVNNENSKNRPEDNNCNSEKPKPKNYHTPNEEKKLEQFENNNNNNYNNNYNNNNYNNYNNNFNNNNFNNYNNNYNNNIIFNNNNNYNNYNNNNYNNYNNNHNFNNFNNNNYNNNFNNNNNNNNNDNNNNSKNNLITMQFFYNGNINNIEFNSLIPIKNQYNKIQEQFNFKEIKPLLYNGEDIDMTKSFSNYNFKGVIEITDNN